jgi:2-oxo-hept-3-ene-1,7-dioate hydratase
MKAPGFEAQLEHFHHAMASGKARLGWKVAFNDPAVQARFGLSSPPIGWIDADAFHPSGASVTVSLSQRVAVEAEVMLTMERDVRGDEPLDALRSAIASVSPAIELIDYTRSGQEIGDMVEHSFFHLATIYGEASATVPRDAELLVTGVTKNGESAAECIPGRVPKDLAEIVRLVATTLEEAGERLVAGDRIICGSYIAPFPVVAGDRATAVYTGELGSVTVLLAGE